MNCPVCEGTIAADLPACDWCTVKLGRDANGRVGPVYPNILPGDVLAVHDFRTAPLPGETARVREWKTGTRADGTPDGMLLTIRADSIYYFAQPNLAMRDGCVRASMLSVDPYAMFGVFVRMQSVEAASIRYELFVRPTERTFSFRRYCGGDLSDVADIAPIVPLTQSELIAPERYPTVVELRAQGPTLQVWLNGQLVTSAHDAALGFGTVGIVVSTTKTTSAETPRRVLCQWLEVREVGA
jgi:hypothetical protein